MTADEFNRWRDRMGFTLQQAADELGQGIDSVKSMSSGRRPVTDTVAILCKALAKIRRLEERGR